MALTCACRALVLASNNSAALRKEQRRALQNPSTDPVQKWQLPLSTDPLPFYNLFSLTVVLDTRSLVTRPGRAKEPEQGHRAKGEVPGLSQGLDTSQTKNISSVETVKFYSKHQEESKVKLKWGDWHQNPGYLCCQNFGWIGSTLTFPEATLPINSSRKCTNPAILIQFPCASENFTYSCQEQQRAGGSLLGIFFNNILTFFRRFSWWVEIPYLNEGETHAALCYSILSSSCPTCWWCQFTQLFKRQTPFPCLRSCAGPRENSTRLKNNLHNNKEAGSGEGQCTRNIFFLTLTHCLENGHSW